MAAAPCNVSGGDGIGEVKYTGFTSSFFVLRIEKKKQLLTTVMHGRTEVKDDQNSTKRCLILNREVRRIIAKVPYIKL